MAEKAETWRHGTAAKTARDWRSSMDAYVLPAMGAMHVGAGGDQRREARTASVGAGRQARHGAPGGGPHRGGAGVGGGGEPARAGRQRPGDRGDGDALAAEGGGGAAPPGAALR